MSATPIPRSLAMALYGDLDLSILDEVPPGRTPVKTALRSPDRRSGVYDFVRSEVSAGRQAYLVYPLVEESETSDIIAVEERYQSLSQIFGDRVGLIHGRMKGLEKDAVMDGFAHTQYDILVATTVIEVGVDVPEATLIIIEQAERFGLAQLHQLRGRVGRGDKPSVCLLLYDSPLSENARARLETMRSTEDGFFIAEEDLRLRGGGEILGTRQSGLPEGRVAQLHIHGDLLFQAHKDAQRILEKNPQLTGKQGEALRTLLYLFERDSAAQTLHSG
ncbi:MAG: ATP-dependent DNA helicase RecG, partial [Bacteroidetes bacterium]|nr:ATP-dependent DNA helicase RecG [Bacteroidota bacterium]